eukprot:14885824-Alexandrium_andersonii.AAC.1
MSASLVGSEMCIRDSCSGALPPQGAGSLAQPLRHLTTAITNALVTLECWSSQNLSRCLACWRKWASVIWAS